MIDIFKIKRKHNSNTNNEDLFKNYQMISKYDRNQRLDVYKTSLSGLDNNIVAQAVKENKIGSV